MIRQLTPTGVRKIWLEWRQLIVFIALMVAFRSAIADWNVVPSGSMQPSILIGDRIWVNKLAYDVKIPWSNVNLYRRGEPERGDIVVFNSPRDGERLVKRVIGLPGEVVGMRVNRLVVNGRPADYAPLEVDESAAPPGLVTLLTETIDGESHPVAWRDSGTDRLANFPAVTVPDDHYLVLGDNRNNSADSRVIGFVPRAAIIGHANSVVVSLDPENYYLPRPQRTLRTLP